MLLEVSLEIPKVIFAYLYPVIGIIDVDVDIVVELSHVYVDGHFMIAIFVIGFIVTFRFFACTFNRVDASLRLSSFHNHYRFICVGQVLPGKVAGNLRGDMDNDF